MFYCQRPEQLKNTFKMFFAIQTTEGYNLILFWCTKYLLYINDIKTFFDAMPIAYVIICDKISWIEILSWLEYNVQSKACISWNLFQGLGIVFMKSKHTRKTMFCKQCGLGLCFVVNANSMITKKESYNIYCCLQ